MAKYEKQATRRCVACHKPVSFIETLDSWWTFEDYEDKKVQTEEEYWFIAAEMPPTADYALQDLYGLHNNLSCRAVHIALPEMERVE